MSRVLLVGSPNSGKSSLFNRLTGLNQHVANFSGVTVDVSSGWLVTMPDIELVDFPGTYSLRPISAEESVAVEHFLRALIDSNVRHVLCVIDATRLEKSLYFTLQVIRECQRHGKAVIILANMADIIWNNKLTFDADGLAEAIGAPVIMVSARESIGLDDVICQLRQALAGKPVIEEKLSSYGWIDTPDTLLQGTAHQLSRRFGICGGVLVRSQARLDRFFLNTFTGGIAFFLIMLILFQAVFTWSTPAMDAVGSLVASIGQALMLTLGPGVFGDFVADALFGGVGAFLVFVPQIFVLTLIISILEDTGYLARAALICHRPLKFFGMTGKSFIPILSGVACAIPAIYAARAIDSPRQRLMTYLAIPLMPCSARLPVYALLIATFIPKGTALFGLVGWQGLAMFCIYFFGMFCALLVTSVISRMLRTSSDEAPFVLELPPYRMPNFRPVLRQAFNRSKQFVTKAGQVIFMVTVVIWVLGYFPNYGTDLGTSWLGYIGKVIGPVFEPLGLDWRYGVAILSSFLAREVFVGTLGTIFGIEGAEDNMMPLIDQIQASGLSIASGLSLLVFFAVALQCVSTVAVLAREAGSAKVAVRMLVCYLLAAYVLALTVFHITGLFL